MCTFPRFTGIIRFKIEINICFIRATTKFVSGTYHYLNGVPSKPSVKGKKQVCLDCNGAVASPALLQMVPHVLLPSTKANKLKKHQRRRSIQDLQSEIWYNRKLAAFSHRVWRDLFFCSSVIPKPHSWKPGFIYHCFAWLLVLGLTRFKTGFAANIYIAYPFLRLFCELPQFPSQIYNLLEKETYSSSAPFPHLLIL